MTKNRSLLTPQQVIFFRFLGYLLPSPLRSFPLFLSIFPFWLFLPCCCFLFPPCMCYLLCGLACVPPSYPYPLRLTIHLLLTLLVPYLPCKYLSCLCPQSSSFWMEASARARVAVAFGMFSPHNYHTWYQIKYQIYKSSAWAPAFAGAHASGRAGQHFDNLRCSCPIWHALNLSNAKSLIQTWDYESHALTKEKT